MIMYFDKKMFTTLNIKKLRLHGKDKPFWTSSTFFILQTYTYIEIDKRREI